jgi:phosphoenolpyruvate carboxykinase (diphosphate)
LFVRETMLQSDWYRERLEVKQERDTALWTRHVAALEAARVNGSRLEEAILQLARVSAPAYLGELVGTIGADPFHGQLVQLPGE